MELMVVRGRSYFCQSPKSGGGGGGQEFFFFLLKRKVWPTLFFFEKKNQNSPALPSPFPNMTNNKHFETVYSYLT